MPPFTRSANTLASLPGTGSDQFKKSNLVVLPTLTSTPVRSKYFTNQSAVESSKACSVEASPKSPSPTTPGAKSLKRKNSTSSHPSATPSSPPQKRKTKPHKNGTKIKPGFVEPPQNWEKIYSLVEELRNDSTAPVDVDGGHILPERHLGEVVYRLQLLVAMMLSSQTKDAVTAEILRKLQKHGLTVENIQKTELDKLSALIRKVAFHNNKAKFIKETAEIIISQYNGDIPPNANEMMKLPGVGPKMAFIVESVAYGVTSGIGVDTHMHRMFNDLKWVSSKSPEQTRRQLEGWLPREKWWPINVLFVGFGQELQQQKEKILRKALVCSSPCEALELFKTLGMDLEKEGKRFGLLNEIKNVIDSTAKTKM